MKNNKNNRSNKRNKILVGSLILAGMTSVGIYAMASADEANNRGRNYSPERHERMERAFENNNYEDWKTEMEKNTRKGRVMDVVNKENFSKFAQMHKLREEGKSDEANKIRTELGLRANAGERGGHGYGKGEGKGNGEGRGNGEHRGENRGGHFEDKDGDGHCDHLNDK